jgi:hypothetical protein
MVTLDGKNELMFCRTCNREVEPTLVRMGSDSPHYMKAICSKCGSYLRWMPKPENEDQRRRSGFSPESLDISYCEICGRPLTELGAKEVLEIHHKIPVCEGGGDVRENVLVVCSACHRMCHWLRLYLNKHRSPQVMKDETSAEDIPPWEDVSESVGVLGDV